MEYLGIIAESDCTGCSSCASSCPMKCIAMESDKKGFLYPKVDRSICIQCGNCETACPALNQKFFKAPSESVFYGCKNSDDSIRLDSSSGGFFHELARGVIDKGGIVYGARFSEDFKKVFHTAAVVMCDVRPMMVSKYVQSEIGLSFVGVKQRLVEGRVVLFTGTPCQIAGLRSFLGRDYDNLILAEIVCHGVPSPRVWDIYLSSLENEYSGKTTFVTFRDKSRSWRHSDFRVEFDNGRSFVQPNRDNPYMNSFLWNLNLRDSCTNCKFKKSISGADITMGDFWGSSEVSGQYDDDIGISVVALNTAKGREVFEHIRESMKGVVELNESSAFVFNTSYSMSSIHNDNSEVFMSQLGLDSFSDLVQSLVPEETRLSLKQFSFIQKLFKKVFNSKH